MNVEFILQCRIYCTKTFDFILTLIKAKIFLMPSSKLGFFARSKLKLFFIQQFENGLKEFVLVKVDICDKDINPGSIKKLLESSKITERLLRNRHKFI